MVRPGKILNRKVAKFEKKQEERAAADDKADKARKAASKQSAKLKAKASKAKATTKVHVADGSDEASGMTAEERKDLRIAKLKANLHAKKTGVRSALNLETAVAHAQATVNKKGGNSLNLKSAQRHDVFVSELNHFNKAMAIPEFKADPFGTIEAHIMQTATMLRKQTPDIGRKVEAKGPTMRHASYGPGSK